MNFQNLCELADREIRLGLQDRALMAKAEDEAGGMLAHAHQIYWRLRAAAIQEEGAKSDGPYVSQLSFRLDAEEKKQKRHYVLVGWMWAFACFVCLTGAYVFPRIAITRAIRGSFSFYAFAVLGVVCLIFAGVSIVVNKRRTTSE